MENLITLPVLLLSLLTGSQTPEVAARAAHPGEAPRYIAPGPRWTGRWIVHVDRDAAQHRQVLAQIGAQRRAKDSAALAQVIAAYGERMALARASAAALIEAHGAKIVSESWLANTLGVEGASQELLDALLALPEVRLLQPDQWAEAQMQIATDAAHHNSDFANTLPAPGGGFVDGTGVTIAMIDSGIDANHAGSGRPHAAFYPGGDPSTPTGGGLGGSRILSAVNASLFGGGQTGEDIHGHGTRMASIAAGAEFNALPDVDDAPAFAGSIRSYKISDDVFGALASTISMDNAFELILQDSDVIVANMSYDGTPNPLGSPNQTIEDAALADVVVTLSAGNTGADLSFAHGAYNALPVGASFVGSKQPLVIPGFSVSAIGPLPGGRTYPQLLAVGEALTCALLDNEAGSVDSFGSSGAAALVAGTAALVRQAAPELTALEVKALLLNTSQATSLGNPAASGFGYLRSDLAVQAALAGEAVQGTIATGQVKTHPLVLKAGAEAAVTLTWNRESSTELTIDDLDLRVRDPLGHVVDWSASLVDNVEQIRFTAALAGVYRVQVIPIFFDGDGAATYALAGVTTPSANPSACSPGAPVLLEQSPAAVPALVQGFPGVFDDNVVTLIGCNFAGLTSLKVQGIPLPFTVLDDNFVVFSMPVPPALGAVPLTLQGAGGTLDTTLNIAPAANVLQVTPNVMAGIVSVWVAGTPGDVFGLAFSPDLVPTVLPGFFSLAIGDGGATLFPFKAGAFNPVNGVQAYQFQGLTGIAGQLIHVQGIVLDAPSLAPPWASTNPASTLFVF